MYTRAISFVSTLIFLLISFMRVLHEDLNTDTHLCQVINIADSNRWCYYTPTPHSWYSCVSWFRLDSSSRLTGPHAASVWYRWCCRPQTVIEHRVHHRDSKKAPPTFSLTVSLSCSKVAFIMKGWQSTKLLLLLALLFRDITQGGQWLNE